MMRTFITHGGEGRGKKSKESKALDQPSTPPYQTQYCISTLSCWLCRDVAFHTLHCWAWLSACAGSGFLPAAAIVLVSMPVDPLEARQAFVNYCVLAREGLFVIKLV